MKSFTIRVLKKSPEKIKGILRYVGCITIGEFSERFWFSIDYWSIEQYKKQWKEGVARLKLYDTSCLIAKITMHDNELVVCAWVLYRVEDIIYFQYHFYPDEDHVSHLPPFDSKTCYQYIRPRFSKTGRQAEEWSIPVKDFFASWHAQGNRMH